MLVEQISNYRILKSRPLGKGACGEVFYGQSKNGTNVAVKVIDINKLTDHIEKQIKNEITTLKSLSSPFIVKMYDCFRSGEHLYIILEFCEDGDLKTFLKNNCKVNTGISEVQALTFMRHLMSGYEALSSKKIIHRDIKPANILLKQGVAKLSDFGFSRVVEDPTKTQQLSFLGTPLYTAPEVLGRQQFSNSCDVWSMGVVFYEMLHGRAPWTGGDVENLYYNIKNVPLQFKASLNKDIGALLSSMLKVERHKRISWDELMKHPLFAQPQGLGFEKEKKEMSYPQAKNIMLDYLKNYLVKSYLLLNTNTQVNFAPNESPLGETEKTNNQLMVERETYQLTQRRNYAFLHMYVLALFWRNRKKNALPENLNYYMEFEYGLIGQAFELIKRIGQDFSNKNKQGQMEWLNYQKTPQYKQLNQLLQKDYMLLGLLKQACRKEIENAVNMKKLHPDAIGHIKKYDENFPKVFTKAMEFNLNILKTEQPKSGVAQLIADYIANCIMVQNKVLESPQANFASYYEKRERDYQLQ